MAAPDLPSESALKKITRAPHDFDLESMSEDDLLVMRRLIDQRLPTKRLGDLNLEQELVLQLLTAQKLQTDTLANEDIPANQKSQVIGTVASALGVLGKLQVEVYTSERLKKVEAVLIGVLKGLPHKAQDEFLTAYEAAIGAMS